MTGEAAVVRMDSANQALKIKFLRWQCRLRQIIMRDQGGRPDDGIMPVVTPAGAAAPLGRIVTVLCRTPARSTTMEFRHMVRRTQDPAQRRAAALTFLGERYYQDAGDFDPTLTASFAPDAATAAVLVAAGRATLAFDRYNQRFDLDCTVWRLTPTNPLFEATYWHNLLFNPNLPADTQVLGFEPAWGTAREQSGHH